MQIQNSKLKTFYFLIALLTFNFYLLTLSVPAYAQGNDIGQSRINPASPLYFLKSIREIVELKFAQNTSGKALLELEFATRRLREVKSLAQTPQEDLIEPTLERYWSHLQDLKSAANLEDTNISAGISGTTAVHMEFLQNVYSQITDTRAKRSLRLAIYRLSTWQQQLIDKLNFFSQYPAAQTADDAKLSACNFLIKEASSPALNEVERTVFAERAQKCLTPKP